MTRPSANVADITTDPRKRLVFAVEITVIPLTGAAPPIFGDEIVHVPALPAIPASLFLRDAASYLLLRDGAGSLALGH